MAELPPFGHALSGGIAGALANVVIYPLDLATTRVQSQSTRSSSSLTASSSGLASKDVEKGQGEGPLPIEFIKHTSSSSSAASPPETTTIVTIENGKKVTRTVKKTTITTTTTGIKNEVAGSSSSSSHTSHSTAIKKERYSSVVDAIRKTYVNEGFAALYSGLGSDTFATITSNFCYFYIYMALRQYKEHRRQSGQLSTLQELILGAEAGILSRMFTTPIHVVTARQQVMGNKTAKLGATGSTSSSSAGSIVRDILKENGPLGLWSGFPPTVILSINPSITYFLFETTKKFLLARQEKALALSGGKGKIAGLSSMQIFFISACSKAIASFLTYPLILVKTKLQTKKEDDGADSTLESGKTSAQFTGIGDVIRTVLRDQGLGGLYVGCQGQVVKGFFSFGLMYMIKDRVVAWMLTIFLAIARTRRGGNITAAK